MADPVVEAEAIEEPAGGADRDAEVRPLPAGREAGELDSWRGEVRNVVIAAAGGLAAGAATIAVANLVRAKAAPSRTSAKGLVRRARHREDVIASRSFLVDVHLLGR